MNGYKTLFFNMLLAAWGVLETANFTALMGTERGGLVLVVIAAIGTVLRYLTKGPVGGNGSGK